MPIGFCRLRATIFRFVESANHQKTSILWHYGESETNSQRDHAISSRIWSFVSSSPNAILFGVEYTALFATTRYFEEHKCETSFKPYQCIVSQGPNFSIQFKLKTFLLTYFRAYVLNKPWNELNPTCTVFLQLIHDIFMECKTFHLTIHINYVHNTARLDFIGLHATHWKLRTIVIMPTLTTCPLSEYIKYTYRTHDATH